MHGDVSPRVGRWMGGFDRPEGVVHEVTPNQTIFGLQEVSWRLLRVRLVPRGGLLDILELVMGRAWLL